jgi:hypothetical protein
LWLFSARISEFGYGFEAARIKQFPTLSVKDPAICGHLLSKMSIKNQEVTNL